jgi:hypothetical protein
LRIVGQQIRGRQPRVVRGRWQQITRAQITSLEPLAPGHPLSRKQRAPAGKQHDLSDGGLGVRGTGDGDRPEPAEVAGQGGRERVRHHPLGLGADAEVLADLRTGDVGRRGPREVDRRC